MPDHKTRFERRTSEAVLFTPEHADDPIGFVLYLPDGFHVFLSDGAAYRDAEVCDTAEYARKRLVALWAEP